MGHKVVRESRMLNLTQFYQQFLLDGCTCFLCSAQTLSLICFIIVIIFWYNALIALGRLYPYTWLPPIGRPKPVSNCCWQRYLFIMLTFFYKQRGELLANSKQLKENEAAQEKCYEKQLIQWLVTNNIPPISNPAMILFLLNN